MSEKKITHYHMDKSIKYLFITVFLVAATVLGYSFKNKASCNDVVFKTEAKNYAVGEAIIFNDITKGAEKWQWTFGDNTSSFQKDPAHYYEQPGEYEVELIVNGRCVGLQTLEIKEAVKIVDSTKFPVFDLPETVRVDEKIIVKDKTQHANTWEWRFGESPTVDSKNRTATYAYKESGLYTVKLIVNNDLDYITKKKIRVLEPVKEVSVLNNRSRRRQFIKDWNIKENPEEDGDDEPKSAPNITTQNFQMMLMQVAKGNKTALDFKKYFCGDINKSVVVNKESMSFSVLCQKITNRKIKITSLQLDKQKGTNCIENVLMTYKNKGILNKIFKKN